MSQQANRREFIQASAVAGIGFWVAGGVGADEPKKDRLRIACVGVGGKGFGDADQAANHGDIVAICDIDENFLNRKAAGDRFKAARKFFDFRQMLTDMGRNIDAVTVSTPDHTHAVAAIMAMKMGKHVYVQKPLTHSVYEARRMREVAREFRVCTQMGNQGSASNNLRTSIEIVQSGALGKVREAHVWTNRPVWPQAPAITARPRATPVPKHVHWDEWIGPAPMRPYSGPAVGRGAYHDFAWRGWWDFGTGALGDMACHTANMPYRALNLGLPTAITAESGELNPETYPAWAKVVFEFPARGEMPAVRLTWYEGRKDGVLVLPPVALLKGHNRGRFSGSGCLLVGEEGTLYSGDDYGEGRVLLPEAKFRGYTPPRPTLPRNGRGDDGMKREWVEAIQKNTPAHAYSNFDVASRLTESILLGNVAIKAGKRLLYDGTTGRITNDSDADKLLKRDYRAGWPSIA
jgi:predicted dehydrogenase